MDSQNGTDAIDRQVQFKLMEDRLKQLKKTKKIREEVLHYAKKWLEKEIEDE